MRIVTNLPGNLRALFGFLRIATVIMAVFWALTLTYNAWIQRSFGHDSRLMATVGEISLPAVPAPVGLRSDTATPGSLQLNSVRGSLQVNLASSDAALVSALRWSIVPSMALLIAFSYVMFAALRTVCANLERGDVFNDQNLRLIRRIGVSLIVYSLLGAGLEIWASHVLGGYFSRHVAMTGLAAGVPFLGATSAMQFFRLPSGLLTTQGAFLVGLLVLVVAEAFRQGLGLKTENDLTV